MKKVPTTPDDKDVLVNIQKIESGHVVMPYDENLLERARTQWQFGDWESLIKIDRDTLQHHPERAKLALLAAAGRLQTGNDAEAKNLIRLSQDWGVSKKQISQILIAGVHNSIGRAAVIGNQQHRALQHFENAIQTGSPGSDAKLITQARTVEQLSQLSLPIPEGYLKVVARGTAVSEVKKEKDQNTQDAIRSCNYDESDGKFASYEKIFASGRDYEDFEFDTNIIYPQDPTATQQRIEQYKNYYRIKHSICKKYNPTLIAEIGVRAGYSAWTFLKACPDATYIGFDANNGTHGGKGGEDGQYFQWAKRILAPFNFELIECDTQKVDCLSISDVDFFHVDGDHSVDGVMHDLDLAFHVLSGKGVILVDDLIYIDTVRDGVNRWLQKMGNSVKYEFIPSLRGEMLISKSYY